MSINNINDTENNEELITTDTDPVEINNTDDNSSDETNNDFDTIDNLSDEDFKEYMNKNNSFTGSDTNIDIQESTKDDTVDNSKNTVDVKEIIQEETQQELDYKELYNNSIKPLKASGKEINIKDINELRTLAQKGVDYTKKMQSIKPKQKIIDTLEENGVLSPEKVNLMIDLLKGDKQALAKHMKELNIDPLDIDTDEVSYKEHNYIPSDEDYDFKQQLTDDYNTEAGKVLFDTTRSWDEDSRLKIIRDPKIRASLMDHVNTGIFQEIMTEIERRSLLGNLDTNIGDTYASIFTQHYNKVRTDIGNTNNSINTNTTPKTIDVRAKVQEIKNTKQIDNKINSLSSPRAIPSKKTVLSVEEINNLPDQEFRKYMKTLKF